MIDARDIRAYATWFSRDYWRSWFQLAQRQAEDVWTETLIVTPELKEYALRVYGKKA